MTGEELQDCWMEGGVLMDIQLYLVPNRPIQVALL